MPFAFEPTFTRQRAAERRQIGLVIPANAKIKTTLPEQLRRTIDKVGPPTVLPGKFGFHYIDWPPDQSVLADEAEVDSGVYTFKVKDAVIGVFDLARWGHQEFCWSFSSNAQRDVLAALRIGETFDVLFDEPLEEAFHVLQYHFPSGVPNSGYGEYAVHLAVDPPRSDGFRIVSAFEPQSRRTESRLPFFFGFRVFGTAVGSDPLPVWRTLLSAAVRQAAHGRWAHCLLYTAFSLESFIDQRLGEQLSSANFGDDYIEEVLRVANRAAELSALNSLTPRLSKASVKKLAQRLNEAVFTPRNRLAHGKLTDKAADSETAVNALKTTVEFVWDWDSASRALLVTPLHASSLEALVDTALLEACCDQC